MCGLAGAVIEGPLAFDMAVLRRMTDSLAHRGPDDAGYWSEAGAYLGSRRLAVVDVTPAGHQPMVSANQRFVLAYNGELYNTVELRAELELTPSAPWRGHSDSEVLLEALARWGVDRTLERANAMFAFALWDRHERLLTLARDPFGEKPLLYADVGHSIVFGSEFTALECVTGLDLSPSPESAAEYLRRGCVPAPLTISAGARKLPPGGCLEWRARTASQPRRYWSLGATVRASKLQPLLDATEAIDALDTVLVDAVRRRMVSDVSVGAFLSGGIDSSIVVAMMQSVSSEPVRTFTIGFADQSLDEAPFARATAALLGTRHTEQYITEREIVDLVPRLGAIYDEPFADSSQIPTCLVSLLARRDVTVVLTGDGGDELLMGYARYALAPSTWRAIARVPARPLVRHAIESAPAPVLRMAASVLRPFIPAGFSKQHLTEKLRRSASLLRSCSLDDVYDFYMTIWHEPARMLREPTAPRLPMSFENAPAVDHPMERMSWWDTAHHLPDDLLVKVDRATMAASLEGRMPFLDRRVAELAWRLPANLKYRGGQGKWVLRQLLQKYLPAHLFERPKQGFGVPLEQWLKGPLAPWAGDLLSEDRLRRQGLLSARQSARAWQAFLKGPRHASSQIWSLLMLQSWLEARGR